MKASRRRALRVATLATLLWAPLLATKVTAGAESAGAQERHCAAAVAALTPQQVDRARNGRKSVPAPKVTCFRSFAEAVSYASGGRVSRAAVARAEGAADLGALLGESGAISTPGRAATNPLLGIHYDYTYWRGGSMTIYATSGFGCYGVSYGVGYVGNYWNDDVESGYSYSNCDHQVFEHYNYSGTQSATVTGFGTYELLNNEVSSILYVPGQPISPIPR